MKFICSRKMSWILCGISMIMAAVSIFFLPELIPVHFANYGNLIPDDFGNKTEIFLYPFLLFLITFLSGREKIKYVLTHSKTYLSDMQYQCIINGVLGLLLVVESVVIYVSFH